MTTGQLDLLGIDERQCCRAKCCACPRSKFARATAACLYSFAVDGKQTAVVRDGLPDPPRRRLRDRGLSAPRGALPYRLDPQVPRIRRAHDPQRACHSLRQAGPVRTHSWRTASQTTPPRHTASSRSARRSADEDKPGWIVDGQQRSAAIRDARIDSFPVCVTAFITDSDEEQRSQFILVNSAKPLPKGLIYELLPATTGTLPVPLQVRKFPARLLYRLNCQFRSPLYRKIRTPTTPEGIVKDNSMLKMLENSLSDGALYTFRDPETGAGDEEKMLSLLIDFWSAVRDVFADAWDKPPRQSRLMHGVGIASLGFLMDAIFDRYSREQIPDEGRFRTGPRRVE